MTTEKGNYWNLNQNLIFRKGLLNKQIKILTINFPVSTNLAKTTSIFHSLLFFLSPSFKIINKSKNFKLKITITWDKLLIKDKIIKHPKIRKIRPNTTVHFFIDILTKFIHVLRSRWKRPTIAVNYIQELVKRRNLIEEFKTSSQKLAPFI